MNDISQPDGLLVLPRLRVQNANAVSSPLTWGFPSPPPSWASSMPWSGAWPATPASLWRVGIVCHAFEAQTFRPNRRQHLVFTQSRNPVYLKRDIAKFIAEGTPAAIVEEGRAHLEVSLVIAANGYFEEAQHEEAFARTAYDLALGMRIAGGSVLPPPPTAHHDRSGCPGPTFRSIAARPLPGCVAACYPASR
jgi:CRISPR-associated protein Csy2